MKVFVLLDRDGTINEEKHYLASPDDVTLLPGAADGLKRLQDLGIGIIIVTNQSGLARGFFSCEELEKIHERLCDLLSSHGVKVNGIYMCPHHPNDHCSCRKPRPGLVTRAAADFGFEPRNAFVIGDNHSDIELGQEVGATTILVRTGYGKENERNPKVKPDYVADNLSGAADIIESLLTRETRNVLDVIY